MPREREREKDIFGRDTRNRASLPDVHGRKIVRAIKEGNATCLRSGEGGRGEGRGGVVTKWKKN